MCTDCRKTFILRSQKKRKRWTKGFVKEAIKDVVSCRGSYQVVATRRKLSRGTVFVWVNEYGRNCKSGKDIAQELGLTSKNNWSGVLWLDAKVLRRRTKGNPSLVLLLAVDVGTLDVVSWMVCNAETSEDYETLIGEVEKCGYKIKVVVSDGEPAILALTRLPKEPEPPKNIERYPRPGTKVARRKPKLPCLAGIPHQYCVVHAKRDAEKKLASLPKAHKARLLSLICDFLFAKTKRDSKRAWKRLLRNLDYAEVNERRVGQFLCLYKKELTTHLRLQGRCLPLIVSSTNGIENVISYLNSKLKLTRKFKTKHGAIAIANLIVVNFRCKVLFDAKDSKKKGKSPLELAGGKIKGLDWLTFSQKSTA